MIIYGAGGHALVVAEAIESSGYIVDYFVSDAIGLKDRVYLEGHPVYHKIEEWDKQHNVVVIAIGSCEVRYQISTMLTNVQFASVVDKSAIVSPSSHVDSGAMVLQGAIVQARAGIGGHTIVNTGAQVDHESYVGNWSHIGPNATLCGNVSVGDRSFIGAGAVVLPGIQIGDNVTVGAGSVVTKDVEDDQVVFGNPAKGAEQRVAEALRGLSR